jgi:hypothetical protein
MNFKKWTIFILLTIIEATIWTSLNYFVFNLPSWTGVIAGGVTGFVLLKVLNR